MVKRWQEDANDIYGRVIRRFLKGDLDAKSFALVFFDLWGTQPPRGHGNRSDVLRELFGILEGVECLDDVDDEALRLKVGGLVDMDLG